MKKRYSDEQIIGFHNEAEPGVSAKDYESPRVSRWLDPLRRLSHGYEEEATEIIG